MAVGQFGAEGVAADVLGEADAVQVDVVRVDQVVLTQGGDGNRCAIQDDRAPGYRIEQWGELRDQCLRQLVGIAAIVDAERAVDCFRRPARGGAP